MQEPYLCTFCIFFYNHWKQNIKAQFEIIMIWVIIVIILSESYSLRTDT